MPYEDEKIGTCVKHIRKECDISMKTVLSKLEGKMPLLRHRIRWNGSMKSVCQIMIICWEVDSPFAE